MRILFGSFLWWPFSITDVSRPDSGAAHDADQAALRMRKAVGFRKTVPARFIRSDGYGITAAGRRYLEPLIRGEATRRMGEMGCRRMWS